MLKVLGPDGVSAAYVALTRESFGRSQTLIIVDEKRARYNLAGYSVKVTPEGDMREHVFVTDAKRRLRALVDSLQTTIKGV
jgi:hypothetical protein